MNVKRLALVMVVAGMGLGVAPEPVAGAKAKASVEVADVGTVSADGQTVTILVEASCARGWTVLEAFVTVSQPQTSNLGGLPLSCTGRTQTFPVVVTALDGAFTPGPAQVSGLVLIERRDRIREAQDSEQVTLVAA